MRRAITMAMLFALVVSGITLVSLTFYMTYLSPEKCMTICVDKHGEADFEAFVMFPLIILSTCMIVYMFSKQSYHDICEYYDQMDYDKARRNFSHVAKHTRMEDDGDYKRIVIVKSHWRQKSTSKQPETI